MPACTRSLRERLVLIAISCPHKPTAHQLIDIAGEADISADEPLDEAAWHALATWANPWRPAPVPTDSTVEVRADHSAWRYCLPEE